MRVEIGGYAWLDRVALAPHQVANIVDRLTIQPKLTSDVAEKVPDPIPLYAVDEARNRLGVPRGFYLTMRKGAHEEDLRVSYGAPMRPLETTARFEGRFAEQATAVDALMAEFQGPWGAAFLQAQPAFGKTCCGLEVARRLGRRTLILVHKEFLLNQWRKRIARFLPGARVGIIQQNRCEFDRTREGEEPDFVIALLQSLTRDDGTRYPQAMYDAFGLIVSDEAHRISAATWASIIPRFSAAYRLGLSATPRRRDGAEDVFRYHIAEVTYVAVTESVRADLRRIYTETTVRGIDRGKYQVKADKLNSAQIINQICEDGDRTRAIVDDIVGAVRAERKIMVVSARLDHLRVMMDQTWQILRNLPLPFVPVLDAYTGEWFNGEVWETTTKGHRRGEPKTVPRTEADLEAAERANVIFATTQMCVDGESIVVDADMGNSIRVRELSPGTRILSYQEETGKIHPVRVSKVWATGDREVLEFKIGRGGSQSCKKIRVTGDHRVLTQRGWVPASEVVVGDWFMTPARFEPDRELSAVGIDEAALIGYFIGDGGVSQMDSGVASFTNTDADIVETVKRLLIGLDAYMVEKNGDVDNYAIRMGGKYGAGVKSKFRLLMERHGIFGCRAWEKILSKDLLWCSPQAAGALIGALISTDGSVSACRFHVTHSSSSRVLAYQIQHVLLRNGIISFVRRCPGTKSKPMEQWVVSVAGSHWVQKLSILLFGHLCPRKQKKLDMCLSRSSAEGGFGRRVPEEHWAHAMRVWRANGKQKKDLGVFASGTGASVHRNGVDASVLEFVTSQVQDATLERWKTGDGTWERVYSISDGGVAHVYDLQMEQNGNFVCDGVVVHNCVEALDIPALDVLLMDTPIADVEQVVGRVRRHCVASSECAHYCPWRAGRCAEKPKPIITDVVDEKIPRLRGMAGRRERFYRTCCDL